MKTNKSFSKRLRVTRNGKVLGRKGGKNHFRAKKSRSKQLAGERATEFVIKNKAASRYLMNTKVKKITEVLNDK